MAKSSLKKNQLKQNAQKALDEAQVIASGIKKPSQNKEQTKLVAQGIQKGIEIYKKQHKEKTRELDKQLKKVKNLTLQPIQNKEEPTSNPKKTSFHKLPWGLLVLSWVGFMAYIFIYQAAA